MKIFSKIASRSRRGDEINEWNACTYSEIHDVGKVFDDLRNKKFKRKNKQMSENLIKCDHLAFLARPTCICYSTRNINLVLFSTFHTQIASRFNAACRCVIRPCALRLQTFFISSLAFIFIFQLICTVQHFNIHVQFVFKKVHLTHRHRKWRDVKSAKDDCGSSSQFKLSSSMALLCIQLCEICNLLKYNSPRDASCQLNNKLSEAWTFINNFLKIFR